MIEFYTMKESLCSEDVGSFTTYGIGVCENNQRLEYISDVFLDQQKAKQFVVLCNRLQLDPLHLSDVIKDAVSSL